MSLYIDNAGVSVNKQNGILQLLMSDNDTPDRVIDVKMLPVLSKVVALMVIQRIREYEDEHGKLSIKDDELVALGIAKEDW